MRKLFGTLLFVSLGYLLPLINKFSLAAHPKIIILILVALFVFLTQPALDPAEASEKKNADKNSIWAIFFLTIVSVGAPIFEWGQFHPESHSWLWTSVGIAFLVMGLSVRLWAIQVLGRFFTATVQVQPDQVLIQEGPYKRVRHPSYLGAYLVALGNAIFLQSWIGLLIAAVLMVVAYVWRIRVEEEALIDHFGDEYKEYRKSTRGLIPFVW